MHPWRRIEAMRFCIPFALAAALVAHTDAAQPSGSLTHDGQFWVQTASGSFSAASAGRLRITASGNVTLRGDSGDRVVYTLARRMQAHSEREARALLRDFEV